MAKWLSNLRHFCSMKQTSNARCGTVTNHIVHLLPRICYNISVDKNQVARMSYSRCCACACMYDNGWKTRVSRPCQLIQQFWTFSNRQNLKLFANITFVTRIKRVFRNTLPMLLCETVLFEILILMGWGNLKHTYLASTVNSKLLTISQLTSVWKRHYSPHKAYLIVSTWRYFCLSKFFATRQNNLSKKNKTSRPLLWQQNSK